MRHLYAIAPNTDDDIPDPWTTLSLMEWNERKTAPRTPVADNFQSDNVKELHEEIADLGERLLVRDARLAELERANDFGRPVADGRKEHKGAHEWNVRMAQRHAR